MKPTAYVPPLYEYKESWQSRLVYTAFRDALEVEKLMGICMSWNNAREYAVLVVVSCFSARLVVLGATRSGKQRVPSPLKE